MIVLRADLSESPIDVASHEALVDHSAAGAVVSFAGVVRNHDGGRGVTRLEYSAHPSAAEVLAEVAADEAPAVSVAGERNRSAANERVADDVGRGRVAEHERVGELRHARLALVHRLDEDQLAEAGVRDLLAGEEARQHADHPAAGRERTVGDAAHEPDARAAVDGGEAAPAERRPELGGDLAVDRLGAGVAAAEDTDRAQGRHVRAPPGRRARNGKPAF